MAVLSDADRARVHRGLMRFLSLYAQEFPVDGINKADLRAAINDTDDWIDSNQANYVASLPQPFKTASGANLKLLVFLSLASMRVGADFARRLFGEVD